MKNSDWSRNSEWSGQIREDFFRHIRRSRALKAQHLTMKAYFLLKAQLYQPALEVLDFYFREIPKDPFLADAHLYYAQALAGLNRIDDAVIHFRTAIQREHIRPNYISTASVDFPAFILRVKRRDLYPEALQELDNFGVKRHGLLPVEEYTVYGLKAMILSLMDRDAEARSCARVALAAAEIRHSGSRYHPTFGIVTNTNSTFHRQLKKLAAA